jgi:cytochrome c oxidase subunit 4
MDHKVTSVATYTIVLAILLGCTALTTLLSFAPMPHSAHVVVGLLIATIKASLVLVVFMHLAGVDRINALVAVAGLFWLAILLAFTFMDYLTRPEPPAAPAAPPAKHSARFVPIVAAENESV